MKIGRSRMIGDGLFAFPSLGPGPLPSNPPVAPRTLGGFRPRGRSDLDLLSPPRWVFEMPPSLGLRLSIVRLGLRGLLKSDGDGGPPVSDPSALVDRSCFALGGEPVSLALVAFEGWGAILGCFRVRCSFPAFGSRIPGSSVSLAKRAAKAASSPRLALGSMWTA